MCRLFSTNNFSIRQIQFINMLPYSVIIMLFLQTNVLVWTNPMHLPVNSFIWSMSMGVSRNLLMFNHQQCKSWHLQETLYWPWLWSCVCSYSGKVVMSAFSASHHICVYKVFFLTNILLFLLQCVGSKYSVRSINNKTTSKLANCKDEKKLTVINIRNITIFPTKSEASQTFMLNKHF